MYEETGKLFVSRGILRYDPEKPKLIVEVDQEVARYYRALIPKWFRVNPQMYPPHISVVRKESPLKLHWMKHEGEEIKFLYSNIVHSGKVYWWLNAFSSRLEEIRLELGLPISSQYTRPPEGHICCFHITLANNKELS